MKILVAEDTRDLNRALEAILQQSGYEVTCVFDGREALDRALSQSFDGIILYPEIGRASCRERV